MLQHKKEALSSEAGVKNKLTCRYSCILILENVPYFHDWYYCCVFQALMLFVFVYRLAVANSVLFNSSCTLTVWSVIQRMATSLKHLAKR